MADATMRQTILAVLLERLAAITVAGGFTTDAGALVFFGETPQLGPDDPDAAIAVIVGDDVPTYQRNSTQIDLPIDIQALAKADLAMPWATVEAVIGDIKHAIELADRTLTGRLIQELGRGRTRTLRRDSESTCVGAAVTYTATFLEPWGQP